MNIKHFCHSGEQLVMPDDSDLQYTGRIDFDDPSSPVFVFPYSSVRMRFTGAYIKVVLNNRRDYWDSYLGFVLDGEQHKVMIPENGKTVCITLAANLENREHDIFFFKRMDSCHQFTLYGFVIEAGASVAAPPPRPERRIEVFGDSVSAGELSEAVDFVGKPDPAHNGEFSNSYYSYAAIAARRLDAELHDVAQGGIPLLHGTGWFHDPDFIGMEEVWDKMEYNPAFGAAKQWNFSRYTPHVVIVAIGQNDSHPVNFMKDDPHGAQADKWRRTYEAFLLSLRWTYPEALIITATTILEHDAVWDDEIDRVCRRIGDPKLVHFLYSRNGAGTQGHARISEAEEMARELCSFIQSFGNGIWKQ